LKWEKTNPVYINRKLKRRKRKKRKGRKRGGRKRKARKCAIDPKWKFGGEREGGEVLTIPHPEEGEKEKGKRGVNKHKQL